MDTDDQHEQEPKVKRHTFDSTSPLERAQDLDGWRLRRMETLKDVIKGPASSEDWYRANEEYRDLERGYTYDDEHEFGW